MNTLEDDIIPYIDRNGLVAPTPVPEGTQRGSDNGTCYTSEYYILMEMNYPNDDWSIPRAEGWEKLIRSCMLQPGLTVRAPGDRAIDAPDNWYGILAASKVLNRPAVAKDILSYGMRHFGFYNPTNKFNWGAFHWRQLQLLFSLCCASNLYKWWSFWLWPLNIYSALVIATSCWKVPTDRTDERRLSWLLIQTIRQDSWLCKIASKIWYKRLYKDYPNGMKDVRVIYYKGNPHPFVTYSKD